MNGDQMIRIRKVRELSGLSTSSIWRREQEGSFPRRRHLGRKAVGWLMSEVLEWINNAPKKQYVKG